MSLPTLKRSSGAATFVLPMAAAKKATRKTTKKAAKRPAAKKAAARTPAKKAAAAASTDWQEATLGQVRRLIREADPDAVEEIKWRKPTNPDGVPVWSHDGILCTGETYKTHVRLTFAKGAFLADPGKVFNSGFAGNLRRAIDIRQGETLDPDAFRALIREAVALNQAHARKR